MSVPSLQAQGGVYLLTWLQEQISIRVDRIYEDSHYTVTGELLVRSIAPGSSGHLHQARANLTSTQTRRTLANHLLERVNHIDWHAVVEQTATMVLQSHREGEPVIQLSDMEMPEGVRYTLWPYLQAGQSTVFFGEGDSGKSYLSLYMGVLVATGQMQNKLMPHLGNVLILDYETDKDTTWERLNRICAGMEIALPDNIFYRYMYQPLATDVERVQQHIIEHKIDLVIVDSAAPASGQPQEDAMTNEYFRALRSFKTTSLTIAHVAKNGKEQDPFGSVFWRNLPRANYRVVANHEPGAPEFVVGVKNTKGNNQARLQAEGYTLSFGEQDVSFAKAELHNIPELSKAVSLTQRIKFALHNGKMTVAELAEELDEPAPSIRTALHRRHRKPGGFIQPTPETWGNSIEV